MAEPEYRIRLFDKALHDRGAFSCGVRPIDNWFRKSITEQIKADRLRVWCATDRDARLVGFYGLTAHEVRPEQAPALARRRETRAIPAIYLPGLAVDRTCQGRGIGGALMGHAVETAVAAAELIGAAALILDVLPDDAFDRRKAFYVNLGFAEIGNGDPGRLFLAMTDARAELLATA
jgi:GNAT superfamily N-acetyltransferase